jgi:hypothetical protein
MLDHLPIYRRRLRQRFFSTNSAESANQSDHRATELSVEAVVALIDRAFTAGYAAKESGRYLRPAKRRFLENLAEELRQHDPQS